MPWALWLISITVILAVTTMPWSNYVGQSHWDRVIWVPFSDHPLLEILGNVALFFPFGYFFPRARHDAYLKVWALPIITGAMLSTGVEFFQVYTHSRFPSTTDICANLLGVIFGLSLQRSE
jgi:glycopeptide antibiotics resistance protein